MKIWCNKLPNGMDVTENKLYEAMKLRGLNPIPQYKIDQMTVDFCFPEHKIVIEVDGPHHDLEEYEDRDLNRDMALDLFHGYKVYRYDAEKVHKNPHRVALLINRRINYWINKANKPKKPKIRTYGYKNDELKTPLHTQQNDSSINKIPLTTKFTIAIIVIFALFAFLLFTRIMLRILASQVV